LLKPSHAVLAKYKQVVLTFGRSPLSEDLKRHFVQTIKDEGGTTCCFESRVKLVITNNVSVISPRELPFVFDALYQFQLRTDQVNRPGVGLAIAKRIIELHNGTVSVHDHGDGGSSFVVRLQLNQKAKLSRKNCNTPVAS